MRDMLELYNNLNLLLTITMLSEENENQLMIINKTTGIIQTEEEKKIF